MSAEERTAVPVDGLKVSSILRGLEIAPIEHGCAITRAVASNRNTEANTGVSQRLVELFMVNKFDDGKNNEERCLKKGKGFFMQAIGLE